MYNNKGICDINKCDDKICKKCDINNKCISCVKGYIYKNNNCIIKCKKNEFITKNKCKKCSKGCLNCKSDLLC